MTILSAFSPAVSAAGLFSPTLSAPVRSAAAALPLERGTWFDAPEIKDGLARATFETLAMVGISTVIASALGLILGMILVATGRGGLLPSPLLNKTLGFIVNVGRAIPFIIFVFILIGFSRAIAGTGSAWQGFTVPLTISAAFYFARLVESNLMGVERGKVEAVLMMGASRTRIMFGVLMREALPALVQSVTILAVTLVGYSAMAGAVGGGGLGAMAQNAGYYNNRPDLLTIVVIVLVLLVMVIQALGDMLSRLVDHR